MGRPKHVKSYGFDQGLIFADIKDGDEKRLLVRTSKLRILGFCGPNDFCAWSSIPQPNLLSWMHRARYPLFFIPLQRTGTPVFFLFFSAFLCPALTGCFQYKPLESQTSKVQLSEKKKETTARKKAKTLTCNTFSSYKNTIQIAEQGNPNVRKNLKAPRGEKINENFMTFC